MVILTIKVCTIKCAYTTMLPLQIFKRNCMNIHPYKRIHPWKSLIEFSDDLLKNIIFNRDGLVALNKPYGIRSGKTVSSVRSIRNNIPNSVDYTIRDALPHIASQLNYLNLSIIRSPEVYMSGVTLLAATADIKQAVELAFIRSEFFANTYWIITVGVPNQLIGQHRLAIKLTSNPEFKRKKAIIISSWSKNEEKHRKIKILKTEYKVLSNSTHNLCSFIELKSSTIRKHAIRLFASTHLYCPILGDNICATMIQKVGNTYVRVDPFLTCPVLPKLDERLLNLLHLTPRQQEIIPTHIHLRSIVLPKLFGETLTITAPLLPFFKWTYSELEFKHTIQENISCKSHA